MKSRSSLMAVIAFAAVLFVNAESAHSATHPSSDWYAEVIGGSGGITLAGKSLKVGDAITVEGSLQTDATGSAVIYLRGKTTTLTLAPNSQLNLVRPDMTGAKSYVVGGGQVRFNVSPSSKPALWLKVRTTGAVMGVRGTDFYTTYKASADQTEIVVYEGKVHFEDAHDANDFKDIPAGYWGGIGGTCGKKVSNLLHLPADKLATLKKPVDVPTQIKPKD